MKKNTKNFFFLKNSQNKYNPTRFVKIPIKILHNSVGCECVFSNEMKFKIYFHQPWCDVMSNDILCCLMGYIGVETGNQGDDTFILLFQYFLLSFRFYTLQCMMISILCCDDVTTKIVRILHCALRMSESQF